MSVCRGSRVEETGGAFGLTEYKLNFGVDLGFGVWGYEEAVQRREVLIVLLPYLMQMRDEGTNA